MIPIFSRQAYFVKLDLVASDACWLAPPIRGLGKRMAKIWEWSDESLGFLPHQCALWLLGYPSGPVDWRSVLGGIL